MRLDERIPNLVSELKSDDIYPSFCPQNGQKLAKYPILSVFDHFSAKNGVTCYPISILRHGLESSLQGTSLRPQNERIINTLFFDPHCNFKTLIARGQVGMKILEK